jgi:L-iditol 2-dehydrogenase
MMKAVVLHEADDMRVEQRPVPEPGPGEVLLKVNVTSICGTDVKVLHRKLLGQPDEPFIMGHEYAGTVAALGPGVDEFKVGERVAVEVHKGCERCENCIKGWYTSCLNYGNLAKGHRAKGLTCDGGFAEYAVNHVNTLYKLPDNLTFEQACMVTTAASPLWAIDLMGGYLAGETVLVQGPGPIGLLAVQLCKALGAERVILSGTRPDRLEIGRRLGADFIVNVRQEGLARRVADITGGKGADSVLECAGGPTSMQEALESVKRGGRIGVVAWYAGPVEMDMNLAVRSNVRIYAARGEGGMNSGRSLALMSAGKLDADAIITHHFALEAVHDAFHTYVDRIGNALKVVMRV